MSMVIAVGVDIAKVKFDVAVPFGAKSRTGDKWRNKAFANTAAGFAALVEWLKTLTDSPVHVCMEATGSYFEPLALYLTDAGIRVSVVNPAQIAQFGRAIGERNKTDRQDAKIIARFCHSSPFRETQTPAAWQAPTPEVRVLRDLLRRLAALLDLHRQEANRLTVASTATQASIQAVLAVLTEQIAAVKAAIADQIDHHPGLKQQSDLLDSIPGVGEATIATVLAELPASVREDVRKADAFTGLAPRRVESGSSVHGRSMMSKQGSPRLRKALYFPAIVACQHNPVVKAFYQRMLQNGLTKKQAVCAAMRKLLHLIIGVLKSGKPFDPSLHNLKIT